MLTSCCVDKYTSLLLCICFIGFPEITKPVFSSTSVSHGVEHFISTIDPNTCPFSIQYYPRTFKTVQSDSY